MASSNEWRKPASNSPPTTFNQVDKSMSQTLPKQTRIVIVGGGIIGCSVAYHLAQRGCRDVLLLEQGEIGGGATAFAAGLVGGAPQAGLRKLIDASAKLYAALEK